MNLLSDVGCHLGSVRENLRMMEVLEQQHNNLEKSLEELQKEKNIQGHGAELSKHSYLSVIRQIGPRSISLFKRRNF